MQPIDPRVFSFLKKLEKNNNRDWFTENKKEFKAIESTIKKSYKSLFEALKVHDDVDQFKIFRIYRDVRFSKNKLPYKTHFGGSFQRRKPELRGGYYLHLEPNNASFIAVGFWDPNKEDLLRIRKEFEMDASEMREIMNASHFKSIWGELEGDELISAPRNFDKEHQNIDLIRKKQYIFTKKFGDTEVLQADFLNTVNNAFKEIKPFFNYMSEVLTTNLNGERII
ncbi:MAG: TIGR02453 family protein [Flavobacteriaceae bacterium]|uniref:DUF2461 domain-containing protein n=1 Tax=Bizionia echini TaxID=649333 RepID=UPI000C98163C|nr:TIGR02453 family protein [Flavobacteriaceae bacterium]